jgi:prefoldin subunit 2
MISSISPHLKIHQLILSMFSRFRLVEETLTPLDVKRRAFRLVGGVLVERTVGEVLPSVVSNRENVSSHFNSNF